MWCSVLRSVHGVCIIYTYIATGVSGGAQIEIKGVRLFDWRYFDPQPQCLWFVIWFVFIATWFIYIRHCSNLINVNEGFHFSEWCYVELQTQSLWFVIWFVHMRHMYQWAPCMYFISKNIGQECPFSRHQRALYSIFFETKYRAGAGLLAHIYHVDMLLQCVAVCYVCVAVSP